MNIIEHDDWVLDIIRGIENERREARIEPICAPFMEVQRMCTPKQRNTVRNVLNELYKAGKIKVWRGINDTIIKMIDDGIEKISTR